MKMANGHCSHCNEIRKLNLYQWYLCDICARVLRSIRRGIEANRGVSDWWEKQRAQEPSLPELVETDPPTLRTIANQNNVSNLDFTAITADNTILFGVEVKTGRNHLKGGSIGAGMSRFQLDVSDIESILDDMEQADSFIPASFSLSSC